MPELPTISGTEGWASLHRMSAVCVWQRRKENDRIQMCGLSAAVAIWHSRWWVNKKHLIVLLRFVNNVVFYIIEPLCSGLSTIWKNSLNLFVSLSCSLRYNHFLYVRLHIYFRLHTTSGDITVSTIEKLDLENMTIAVGILFIGATEFEINVGGNLTPPPLDIRSVKNPIHWRVKLIYVCSCC